MKCFFDFMTDEDGNKLCAGPVRPSAAPRPTHGYCAVHAQASAERALWDPSATTAKAAASVNLAESRFRVMADKKRRRKAA